MLQDLLSYSKKQKKTANKIFNESNIIDLLGKYGEVSVTGSYALDTMHRPEIDIWTIGAKHNHSKARQIYLEIFKSNYFDMLCFVKALDTTFEKKITGYYIQPHKNIGKVDWKIDVWLTTKDQFKPTYLENLERINNSPNPEKTRNLIINLKKHFSEGSKYKNKLSGDDFYKTVLDNPDLAFEELIKTVDSK